MIMLPNNINCTLLGNDNDMICMTHVVFLKYMSEGINHSGMLTVDYEYSPNLSSINYLDVQYSDPRLQFLSIYQMVTNRILHGSGTILLLYLDVHFVCH